MIDSSLDAIWEATLEILCSNIFLYRMIGWKGLNYSTKPIKRRMKVRRAIVNGDKCKSAIK